MALAQQRYAAQEGQPGAKGTLWLSVGFCLFGFRPAFRIVYDLNRKTNSPAADAANASRRLEALSAEFEASEARSFELEGARRCFMRVFVPL